jgi:hypothetical protein
MASTRPKIVDVGSFIRARIQIRNTDSSVGTGATSKLLLGAEAEKR